MWTVVQIKAQVYQHFSPQIYLLCSFSFLVRNLLNILTVGNSQKTTLLIVISLHNKTAKTLKYDKTDTTELNYKLCYSEQKC